jgi:hypothetical protein
MGISWGSIPQGSPLSNHPSRRRRAQVLKILLNIKNNLKIFKNKFL